MQCYCLLLCYYVLLELAVVRPSIWQAYQIDQQLAVYFPTPPRELDVPKTMAAAKPDQKPDPKVKTSQGFVAEDKVALYVVIKVPLEESANLPRTYAERVAYYRARTIPILSAKRELLAQDIHTENGIDLITVKTRGFDQTGSVRVLTIGKAVYQLHFAPKDKTGDNCASQRQKFFSIIPLTPQR